MEIPISINLWQKMESMLFPPLKLPEFQIIQISSKKFISSKFLYSNPKNLFRKVVFNFLRDESYRKFYISKSPYTQFVKEFSKTNRVPNILKQVKNEWGNMDDQKKEMYRGQDAITETKHKVIKSTKKCRPSRCSYSIYVELKCKEKSRSYEELGTIWKNLTEAKKEPYKILHKLDQERHAFEQNVFSRFELVVRLFGASTNKKILKKHNGFSVFKEEYRESMIERGFSKLGNLTQIGRKRYTKLEKDVKEKYKLIAKTKNDELIDMVFQKVLRKSNLDYGEFNGTNMDMIKDSNAFEEDFDEFIKFEEDYNF